MPNVTASTSRPVTGISADTNPFAEENEETFGNWLRGRIDAWGKASPFGLHAANVSLSYAHMHGLDVEGVGANSAAVTRSGEQGTIAEIRIPVAASLVTKVHNVVVGPELVWTPVASNTDYASEAKTIDARNALQYYWVDMGVGPLAKKAREASARYGDSFIHLFWDENAGEDAGADGDQVVKQGDINAKHIFTWDYVRDPSYKAYDDCPFTLHREFHNKFDVAASLWTEDQSPEGLAALEKKKRACLSANMSYEYWSPLNMRVEDTDLIPVYVLYHRITPSVRTGRHGRLLADGTVLRLEPLDPAYYKTGAVHRISAGEYEGTPFPWSKTFGILGAQQGGDALRKDLLTNATAVSSNLISYVEGSDSGIIQAAGGGPSLLPRAKDDPVPEVLNLHGVNPEAYKLDERLQALMQQIMGLDGLTAGTESAAQMSGAAEAVWTSTTVQNNSQDQAEWARFVSQLGTAVFQIIEKKMPTPRKVALAGVARSSLVTTTLSSDTVKGYDRVQVTVGGALQQTEAGKLTFAEMMMKGDGKTSWVQTPQQLQTLLDTGRSDALTQDLSNELLLITAENEMIAQGQTPVAVLSDNHALHLKLNKAPVANVEARKNPAVVNAQQAHEQYHIDILRKTDPAVLQALGQTPLPPPPPPGMPPGPPNAPPAAQAGPGTQSGTPGSPPGPGAAPQPPSAPPAPGEGKESQTAAMPINPVNGQRAAPAGGTMPPGLAVRPS